MEKHELQFVQQAKSQVLGEKDIEIALLKRYCVRLWLIKDIRFLLEMQVNQMWHSLNFAGNTHKKSRLKKSRQL